MKDKIKDAFHDLKMDEGCAANIEAKLKDSSAASIRSTFWSGRGLQVAAVAIALLVLFAICNLDATAAHADNNADKPIMTVYYSYNRKTGKFGAMGNLQEKLLRVKNGRLFFVGNGEHIDITDIISEDEPFAYSFVDGYGMLVYLAFGGIFTEGSDDLTNIGYDVHVWLPDEEGDGLYNNGIGGYGAGHYNNQAGDYYEWYKESKNNRWEIMLNGKLS